MEKEDRCPLTIPSTEEGMKPQYISDWKTWKKLCIGWEINPYMNFEFSEGLGGGDTKDYKYIGDIPEKEE